MNETEQKTDLREVLAAARRRRWALAITALSGLLITAGLALFLPAYYRSAGIILIEQQELPAELVRSTVTSYADQRVQLISQRVMTTKNLLDIIARYDLYPERRKRDSREKLIMRMREDIRLDMINAPVIDPRSGTPREATIAFSVSYTSPSPAKAVKVANELTSLYLNENVTERTRLAQDASSFLDEEAKRLSSHIDTLEAKMAQFKSRNSDSLPEVAMLNIQMLDRSEQDLRAQQARLTSLEEQSYYLEAQFAQVKPNSALMSESGERIMTSSDRLKTLRSRLASARALYADGHPDIVRMKREIAGLEADPTINPESASNDIARRLEDARTRLTEARKKFSVEHPDLIRVEREVATLDSELTAENSRPAHATAQPVQMPDNPIYMQLQTQLNANQNERRSVAAQVAELRRQIAGYQRKISLSPQTEQEYRELARDYTNSQAKYQEIRSKQMEAQVAQNLEADRKGERFTLIEPPLPPEEPVSPNLAAIWIAGVLLSLALAAGVAALRESLDATVRGRKDMVTLLSEAPLALIPQIATAEDVKTIRQRWRYAMGTVAVLMIGSVFAVHYLYRPVDVLWYVVLRKFGL